MSEQETEQQPVNEKTPITIEQLPEFLQVALENVGWSSLTDVQAASLPYTLEYNDVMVQAKTGSGKTGAFILPLIERIDPIEAECQALILVPTRELAVQVVREAESLTADMGVNVVPVYGGVKYEKQIRAFREGAHIVVGTPGRVIDHLQRGSLNLDLLNTLIFDEADRMLSMGFYYDMLEVKRFLPEEKANTFMFSATFPVTVRSLANQFLHEASFVNLSTDSVHVEELGHLTYLVPQRDKDKVLIDLLELEAPDAAVIFCNTKQRVNYVTVILRRFGYDADQLTSDLEQHQRERVLDRVRDRKLKLLVATDVAARGIDIPHLSHSIQYELPDDLEVYIHRAGRTGRGGAKGTAFALVSELDEMKMHKLAKQYKIDFDQRALPTASDIATAVAQRLMSRLDEDRKQRDPLSVEGSKRFIPFVQQLGREDHAESAELVAMLLDDYYKAKQEAKPEPKQEKEAEEQDAPKQKKYDRRGKRRDNRR